MSAAIPPEHVAVLERDVLDARRGLTPSGESGNAVRSVEAGALVSGWMILAADARRQCAWTQLKDSSCYRIR